MKDHTELHEDSCSKKIVKSAKFSNFGWWWKLGLLVPLFKPKRKIKTIIPLKNLLHFPKTIIS